MKIMTNKRYDIICDIVMNQKRLIEKKEAEIKRLKQQVQNLQWAAELEQRIDEYDMRKQNLSSIYGSTAGQNIDFPNSNVHSEIKSPDDRLF